MEFSGSLAERMAGAIIQTGRLPGAKSWAMFVRGSMSMKNFAVILLARLVVCAMAAGAATNEPGGAKCKYEDPAFLESTIYTQDSNRKKVLYRCTRQAVKSGSELNVTREYCYPNGEVAARERIVYAGDNLRSYSLEELQTKMKGTAVIDRKKDQKGGGTIVFQYGAAEDVVMKTKREELQPDVLINDMVGPFLKDHWDALMSREAVKCRYLVVPRRETVGFTFRKEREIEGSTGKLVIIKMAPTSLVLNALVDPLFFTMEKEGKRHVLEYSGRTTPKIQVKTKWKDLDAVTVFEWKTARTNETPNEENTAKER
jgi:hypothetical protein